MIYRDKIHKRRKLNFESKCKSDKTSRVRNIRNKHCTQIMLTAEVPYYRKLTLHEIKVLEINANLMENDFRIKKINAKQEIEFHNKRN